MAAICNIDLSAYRSCARLTTLRLRMYSNEIAYSAQSPKVNQKRIRNYGIDLLKIVSMLMVVVLHILGQGGVLEATIPGTPRWAVAWLCEAVCYGAVNQFALASGYVGVTSSHKPSNTLSIWLQTFFWSFGIMLIGHCLMPSTYGVEVLIRAMAPISTGVYWYMSACMITMLIAPGIDVCLNQFDRRGSTLGLVILVFFF